MSVDELTTALGDPSVQRRRSAAERLGRLSGPEAVQALIRALDDTERQVVSAAAQSLARIASRCASSVIALLRDANPRTRRGAVRALGGIPLGQQASWLTKLFRREAASRHGKPTYTVITPLIAALRDRDPGVRRTAAWALGNYGSELATPALVQGLQDAHGGVREAAAWALGNIGSSDAVIMALEDLEKLSEDDEAQEEHAARSSAEGEAAKPSLVRVRVVSGSEEAALQRRAARTVLVATMEGVRDKRGRVRKAALDRTGHRPRRVNEKALDALMDALEDGHGPVRCMAGWALGCLGSDRAVPYLREALRHETDKAAFREAAWAVLSLGGGVQVALALVEGLWADAHDTGRVLAELSKEQRRWLTDALLGGLRDKDMIVRQETACALGRVGGEEVAGPLTVALCDPESDVREAAAWALGEIRLQATVMPLMQALRDGNPGVRIRAAQALDNIRACSA